MKLAVCIFLVACSSNDRPAQDAAGDGVGSSPGRLDDTFSGDGIATTEPRNVQDRGRAITVQADGKIVVAGKAGDQLALIRYLTNGEPDPSFGATGMGVVRTDIPGSDFDEGKSLAIQPDGKIVLGGITTIGANGAFAVARYLSDGAPDLGFSDDGVATANFGAQNDEGKSVAVLSDGKVLVAGQAHNGNDRDFAFARFDDNGVADGGFGASGKLTVDFGDARDAEGNSLVVQPDGKLVVAGIRDSGTDDDFAVARFTPDGQLDEDFAGVGFVATAIGTSDDLAFAAALDASGRVVVAGVTRDAIGSACAVARYDTAGRLDPMFGDSGIAIVSIGVTTSCTSLALQADGRIVLGGSSDGDSSVIRLLPDGALDTAFGDGGKVTVSISNDDDGAFAATIQPDGKILVAGESLAGTNYVVAVARLHD